MEVRTMASLLDLSPYCTNYESYTQSSRIHPSPESTPATSARFLPLLGTYGLTLRRSTHHETHTCDPAVPRHPWHRYRVSCRFKRTVPTTREHPGSGILAVATGSVAGV